MGQITVEKNVGGIEGLCVITPAVHGDSADILWKHTIRKTWKRQDFTWISFRTISPAPRKAFCAASIFKSNSHKETGARHPRIRL